MLGKSYDDTLGEGPCSDGHTKPALAVHREAGLRSFPMILRERE